MSIGSKMVEVMRALRTVGKDAVNDTQNYRYTSAATLFAKINAELTARNLFTKTELKLENLLTVGDEKFAVVSAKIVITDTDNGESVTFIGVGSGQDIGDKSVMKANTAALKYAYVGGLCIAMSDDPEADTGTNAYKKPNPAGMNNIAGKCDRCGKPMTQRAIDYSCDKFGERLCRNCQP